VALVVTSCLPWFGYGGSDHNAWKNPWSALGVLVGVVMVVQIFLARFSSASMPTPPVPWGQVHLILGAVAVGLILLQYIVGDRIKAPPIGPGIPSLSFELQPKFGIFLGSLVAVGLAYGGFRKWKEPEGLPGR